MPRPRSLRLLVGVALLAVGAMADLRPAHARDEAWQVERTSPHPGVEVTTMLREQPPLAVHTVRISPDAQVELRPVLASGAVGDGSADRGHEATSSMCARVNGIVCVNADFNACPGCREPFGGVVVEGRVLRSFNGHHEQLSVGRGGLTTERVQWSGAVRANYAWRQRGEPTTTPPRTSVSRVDLAGLNLRIGSDEAIAYTSEWAPTAPAPAGSRHLYLVLSGPLVPGSLTVVSAERTNPPAVAANGVVIAATGSAAERLDGFWEEWLTTDADERTLVIETATSQPLDTSVGGHPVLLRGGQVLELNQRDPKVHDRHPRTLAGWSADGDLFLLTVDGRQPGYSQGVTLVEAQQLLLSIGVVDGLNLDGGGSSTFVEACGSEKCVRNRPSDGGERRVTVALAVVAAPGRAASAATHQTPPVASAGQLPPSDPVASAPKPTMGTPVPAPPSPAPTAETSPAPPSPPPVSATPPPGVEHEPAAAARPSAEHHVVVAQSPQNVGVPASAPGRTPAAPVLSLEVAAVGLWLATVVCTVADFWRWVRRR